MKVEQPDFFKLLVENSREIICLHKADGSFLYANPAFTQAFGYTAEEVYGSIPNEWVHPEDRDALVEDMEQLFREHTLGGGKSVQARFRVRSKFGEYHWLQSHFSCFLSPITGHLYILANSLDVTDQTELEAYARSTHSIRRQGVLNEQKFQAIFQSLFQFTGLLTPDGILIEANQSGLRFADVPLDAVIDKPFWDLYWWTSASRELVRQFVARAAKGEFIRQQLEVVAKKGNLLTLDFSIKPILDDQGQVVLLIPEARNVTRQKRDDARLRLTQFSIDQASQPVIWIQADGTVTYINDWGAQVLGYTRDELIGAKVWEFNLHYDAQTYRAHWEDLKRNHLVHFEADFMLRTGDCIALEVRANYLSFGEEEINVSFFTDVTARRSAAIGVAESEKRLRDALEGTGGGLWDWNLVTGEFYLSPVWKAMLGFGNSELDSTYQAWYSLIHPEDKSRTLQILQSVYEPSANSFSFLHRLKGKDTNYHHILSRGVVIQRGTNGKPERMIGINTDLTEQIGIQEKLLETQERFHHAFAHSWNGMALVAPGGGWIDVNDAVCRITGYSRTELLQMTFQDITHPDDLGEDLKLAQALLEGRIPVIKVEKRYIHKQGNTIWTNLSSTVIRDKEGTPLFFVSHIQDITDLKITQQSLEKQNLRLTSIAENLRRKNRQLAEFSQIVSHNLRAPVSNINILLQYYKNADTPAEKDEIVDLLTQSTQALYETLHELSEVIKVQQDKHIQKENIHFEQVFDKVLQLHAPQIADLKATILHDFAEAPVIRYPRIYLESILMNLVSNGLKYRSPGRRPVLRISTFVKEGNLFLEVSDNGLGINLEKHGDNLFKLYKTFHKHPDAKGLGLYMTKNQVEAMGGKIFVESKEFEGTKFIINFNQYLATHAQ